MARGAFLKESILALGPVNNRPALETNKGLFPGHRAVEPSALQVETVI